MSIVNLEALMEGSAMSNESNHQKRTRGNREVSTPSVSGSCSVMQQYDDIFDMINDLTSRSDGRIRQGFRLIHQDLAVHFQTRKFPPKAKRLR